MRELLRAYVDTIETISPDAVPLPAGFLDGPRDSWHGFDAAEKSSPRRADEGAHSPPARAIV
jgi:hypothetical protein